jgi:DNA-directed RNA polymerase sigma subunit (sigma70/sigma32)
MLGGNVVSCGDHSKHPGENLDDDHSASATFAEIAKVLGVSRQRARNIYEMALAKVRDNPELMAELREYL